jgi:hypothetical protein
LAAKKAIFFIVFFLFLLGACGLAAYAFSLAFNPFKSLVFYLGTAIAWGVILLVLYLIFERLEWEWWT